MPNGDIATTGVMIALLVVAFYLMIVRPQKKRASEQEKVVSELQPGTVVMLAGGLIGRVKSVTDKHVLVELSPGVVFTVLKQAVLQTLTEAEAAELPIEFPPADNKNSFEEALSAAESNDVAKPEHGEEGSGKEPVDPQQRKSDDSSAQN